MKTMKKTRPEALFKLGLQELDNNNMNDAKEYFKEASIQGHKYANRYFMCLYFCKNKILARNMILCAEKRIVMD